MWNRRFKQRSKERPENTGGQRTFLFLALAALLFFCRLNLLSPANAQQAQEKSPPAADSERLQADLQLPLPSEVSPYIDAAKEKWGSAIQAWETIDKKSVDPKNAILLIGSSSIRKWDSAGQDLAGQDLAPCPVIGRGYGGAKFTDVAVFAERLIRPHDFRAIVIFVGNDITGGQNDRPQPVVEACIRHVVKVAQHHRPNSPVVLVEITPTQKRRAGWPKIRQLNAFLREFSLTMPNVSFVSTAEWYLDSNDHVREELFAKDKLHLNQQGYEQWGKLIRRELDRVL